MAWYKDWFNSPYYHILYGKRNDAEANLFIKNIAALLKFKDHELALDLACGKGRHSKELSKYNLIVKGVDLSAESIRSAKNFETKNLTFEVHDMRKVLEKNHFDYVFNLFTSFGYFPIVDDNLQTLQAIHDELKQNGTFIQDYFNAECVEKHLIPFEEKEIKGIKFSIEKKIADRRIIKSIRFSDKGEDYHYTEEVNLFSFEDFKKMYKASGLKITDVYGDYALSAFDPAISNRIILISSPL
jgi:SAM-dependent methyltransferase